MVDWKVEDFEPQDWDRLLNAVMEHRRKRDRRVFILFWSSIVVLSLLFWLVFFYGTWYLWGVI
jgi:hypothetical protein